MTYQIDEKHLTIFPEYFFGVVKLAYYLFFEHSFTITYLYQ